MISLFAQDLMGVATETKNLSILLFPQSYVISLLEIAIPLIIMPVISPIPQLLTLGIENVFKPF